MVQRQFRTTRVEQIEEGTSDKADAEVVVRVSLSVGSQKLRVTHVVIG
jgi:hypothetical protein